MRLTTRPLGWLSLHEKRIPEVPDTRRKMSIHTQTEGPTQGQESESTPARFEEAFESFRDHEENGNFGEMEYLFGLYEDELRFWREQQDQSPIDTRDFTNENPGESLLSSTPPEPLGDHRRERESLRLPYEAKDENSVRYETLIMRPSSTRIPEHQHHCKSPPAKSTTLSVPTRERKTHTGR